MAAAVGRSATKFGQFGLRWRLRSAAAPPPIVSSPTTTWPLGGEVLAGDAITWVLGPLQLLFNLQAFG